MLPACSFCGASWTENPRVIVGPGVCICDECVARSAVFLHRDFKVDVNYIIKELNLANPPYLLDQTWTGLTIPLRGSTMNIVRAYAVMCLITAGDIDGVVEVKKVCVHTGKTRWLPCSLDGYDIWAEGARLKDSFNFVDLLATDRFRYAERTGGQDAG